MKSRKDDQDWIGYLCAKMCNLRIKFAMPLAVKFKYLSKFAHLNRFICHVYSIARARIALLSNLHVNRFSVPF